MIDPNAGLSTYAYDRNGQTTEVRSEAGLMQMTYDSLGNMTDRKTWGQYDIGEDDAATGIAASESSFATWTYDYDGGDNAPLGALVKTESTTRVSTPTTRRLARTELTPGATRQTSHTFDELLLTDPTSYSDTTDNGVGRATQAQDDHHHAAIGAGVG